MTVLARHYFLLGLTLVWHYYFQVLRLDHPFLARVMNSYVPGKKVRNSVAPTICVLITYPRIRPTNALT